MPYQRLHTGIRTDKTQIRPGCLQQADRRQAVACICGRALLSDRKDGVIRAFDGGWTSRMARKGAKHPRQCALWVSSGDVLERQDSVGVSGCRGGGGEEQA